MEKSQYSRRDRMIQEERHDTYRERGKWPEPTVCKECGSLFQDGRWSWNRPTKEANKAVCPACQRIADNCPAGYVEIRGTYFQGHREELLNLIRREEKLEKGEHPTERIISIVDEEDRSLVTTTGLHIAQRIGKALSRACRGDLSIHYSDDEKSIRVYWSR
jgi:NMD protein affecting ribosome stability and mRNA decay